MIVEWLFLVKVMYKIKSKERRVYNATELHPKASAEEGGGAVFS